MFTQVQRGLLLKGKREIQGPSTLNTNCGGLGLNSGLSLEVCFVWTILIRINDPRSLGSLCIKGTNESTLGRLFQCL